MLHRNTNICIKLGLPDPRCATTPNFFCKMLSGKTVIFSTKTKPLYNDYRCHANSVNMINFSCTVSPTDYHNYTVYYCTNKPVPVIITAEKYRFKLNLCQNTTFHFVDLDLVRKPSQTCFARINLYLSKKFHKRSTH